MKVSRTKYSDEREQRDGTKLVHNQVRWTEKMFSQRSTTDGVKLIEDHARRMHETAPVQHAMDSENVKQGD